MATNQPTDTQELNKMIELGQALHRLENNPDFKLVIKDSYIMNTLVVKSQGMLAVAPHERQEALEEVQSVNYLRNHLTSIRDNAAGAVEVLNDDEE